MLRAIPTPIWPTALGIGSRDRAVNELREWGCIWGRENDHGIVIVKVPSGNWLYIFFKILKVLPGAACLSSFVDRACVEDTQVKLTLRLKYFLQTISSSSTVTKFGEIHRSAFLRGLCVVPKMKARKLERFFKERFFKERLLDMLGCPRGGRWVSLRA